MSKMRKADRIKMVVAWQRKLEEAEKERGRQLKTAGQVIWDGEVKWIAGDDEYWSLES